MLRVLILFPSLFLATVSLEVASYAKVSKNGQLARSSQDSFSWITRALARSNMSAQNEDRSINDIAITVSPVYVSSPKLKKGEAIDYSVARYSTLDREAIAKLDAAIKRKQIQQRFHPPAVFDHDDAQSNGRPQKGASMSNSGGGGSISSLNSSSFLPGPISFAGMYEYSPPDFLDDKPASKPTISVDKYPSMQTDDKTPNSYKSPPSDYHVSDETEYPNFDIASTLYENDSPAMTKPMKFAGHNHDRPSFPFVDDTYGHDFIHHDDVIYDHVPDYHHHHHHHEQQTTTPEPEMNDQRLDKRPYSYYFIGKKLWYVPLYFSIYFIIYIAALVLKSIARHKINLPTQLAEAAGQSRRRSEPDDASWWNIAGRILEGVERFAETSVGERS